jgi:ribose/xylose/arabinose/galactoside ABC-type transport system permease subunit
MTVAVPESPGRSLDRLAGYGVWIVLAVMLAIAGLLSEAFLRPPYLLNLLRQAAPVGITAVGVTFVMIAGGVDLSVGAVISAAAVLCAVIMDGRPAMIAPALVATLALGLGAGLLNGVLAAFSRVSPFILTLGTATAIYGFTLMLSGGTAKGAVSPGFREFLNARLFGALPVLALMLVLLAAVGAFVQKMSIFGRSLYLLGANRRAAYLSGLPVSALTIAAYALSGFCAALGGIALLARTGVSSTYAGRGYEFDVLAAVVLGGTTFRGGEGGVGGTVAGVLVLLIAFNIVNLLGLPFATQLGLKGVIIILASGAYEGLRRRA